MEIEQLTHKIGDTVYYSNFKYESMPCDICEGNANIDVIFKDEHIKIGCPKCHGCCIYSVPKVICIEAKIEKIAIYIRPDETEIRYTLTDDVWKQNHEIHDNKEDCLKECEEEYAEYLQRKEEEGFSIEKVSFD